MAETVLNRGVLNTRPRDYYDIYILRTTQNFDMETYRDALKATSEHRGSIKNITDIDSLLVTISSSQIIIDQWEKYRKKYSYAREITWEMIMNELKELTSGLQIYR